MAKQSRKKKDDSWNMMGTLMGTHKEQGKFPLSRPFQTPKGKNMYKIKC
jgi:hypothetical protein